MDVRSPGHKVRASGSFDGAAVQGIFWRYSTVPGKGGLANCKFTVTKKDEQQLLH